MDDASRAKRHPLDVLAGTMSVSYRERLDRAALDRILRSGRYDDRWAGHVMTMVEETPLEMLARAVQSYPREQRGEVQAGLRALGVYDWLRSDRAVDDWLILFRRALAIIDAAPGGTIPGDWAVGGGTMLFRRYGHRRSRDIDIFLSSPQSLPALSPRLNDEAARRTDHDASYTEQSHFLKLAFPDGDIDFIVAPHLTQPFAERADIAGRQVWVETPAEILAKKVLYRADDFTARDVFDFAFLIGTGDAAALLDDPGSYRAPALRIVERLDAARPALRKAFSTIEGLAFRPTFDECEAAILAFAARFGQ